MRLLTIILIAITGTLQECENSRAVGMPGYIDQISLSIHQYPTKEIIKYVIDSNSVRVRLVNNSIGIDSLLEEKTIGGFRIYENDIRKFKKRAYSNKCIEDGQVITLAFMNNDSTLKKVRFSNYYDDDLERVIRFINSNVDTQYQISYDKAQLVNNLKKCK